MVTITLDPAALLATAATVAVTVGAFMYRQAQQQTEIRTRVNWLCNQYARDHETVVPWEEPITDGGDPNPEAPELFDEESDVIAAVWGLWHGFRRLDPRPNANRDVSTNKVYYYPLYIVGYLLKLGTVLLAVRFGLPAFA